MYVQGYLQGSENERVVTIEDLPVAAMFVNGSGQNEQTL